MNKLFIIALLLFVHLGMKGQSPCDEAYDQVDELQDSSYSVLRRDDFLLARRIHISKKLSRKALKIAYAAIRNQDCEAFSKITDKIISLEMKLGHYAKAEKAAIQRLNKVYPNWQDKGSMFRISPRYIAILAQIQSAQKARGYYQNVRKYKGAYGVCGTISYFEEVLILLETAVSLYQHYGPSYCLRFLENSNVILNEDVERVKPLWDQMYKLIIQSLLEEYSIAELLEAYQAAKIEKHNQWNEVYLIGYENRGKYYIRFKNSTFYFQQKEVPENETVSEKLSDETAANWKYRSRFYKELEKYVLRN